MPKHPAVPSSPDCSQIRRSIFSPNYDACKLVQNEMFVVFFLVFHRFGEISMRMRLIAIACTLLQTSAWAQTPPDIAKLYGGHPDELSRLKISVIAKPAIQQRSLAAAENLSTVEQQTIQQLDKLWAPSPARSLIWVKGGKLLAERYKSDTNAQTPVLGASMGKSVISLAVGYALCASKIRSLDDAIGAYVPEISSPVFAATKIRHLLSMTSGAGYSWSAQDAARFNTGLAYGGQTVLDDINAFKGSAQGAGENFSYSNRDTNALGILLQKVGGKPLAQVISETVWQQVGAEGDALLMTDHAGQGVASGFVWATARDWARVGLLINDLLQPSQATTCMGQYMQQAASKQTKTDGGEAAAQDTGYGFQFWTEGPEYSKGTVLMKGTRGQRVAIDAKSQNVLSTLGTDPRWIAKDYWSLWSQITRLP
jgi:CubicO group peptidase (beta-lactamase class C family)